MSELKQKTLEAVQKYLNAGAIQISSSELKDLISPLGYKLGDSFCYTNNLNHGESWAAKSVSIICKATGKSFANVEAKRDNLRKLQEIRRNYFVFERGKLWEI